MRELKARKQQLNMPVGSMLETEGSEGVLSADLSRTGAREIVGTPGGVRDAAQSNKVFVERSGFLLGWGGSLSWYKNRKGFCGVWSVTCFMCCLAYGGRILNY